MHPRNRYCRAKPDFARLALADPRLAPHLTHGHRRRRPTAAAEQAQEGRVRQDEEPSARRPTAKRRRDDGGSDRGSGSSSGSGSHPARILDFTNPAALVALTRALLRVDFGLEWDMPLDRLCPTVTSRLNYLHWVEDLLALSAAATVGDDDDGEGEEEDTTALAKRHWQHQHNGNGGIVRGLDIGTGASCIYPLLGVAMHDNWHFVATDIDPVSLRHAMQNVTRNNLNKRVALLLTDNRAAVLRPALNAAGWRDGTMADTVVFDFTICNPPFFDEDHMLPVSTATGKSATTNETIYPGGEVAFVTRIAEESAALPKSLVTWYSAMLGIRASLKPLVATLHRLGAVAVRSTRLEQGRKYRWAIAWSFTARHARAGVPDQTGDMGNVLRSRPRMAVNSTGGAAAQTGPKKAARNRYTRLLALTGIDVGEVRRRIDDFVVDNDGWEKVESGCSGGGSSSSSSSSAFPVWGTTHAGDDDNDACDTEHVSMVSSSNGWRVRLHLTLQQQGQQPDGHATPAPGVGVEILVETIDSSRPLNMSGTARLMQRLERDLKRTGRYWRRRLAAQVCDQSDRPSIN